MPIKIGADLRRMTQEEFGEVAYRVMGHAFDIHRELGRFFDEKPGDLKSCDEQYRRFLNHTARTALHWVNVSRELVTFKTLLTGME